MRTLSTTPPATKRKFRPSGIDVPFTSAALMGGLQYCVVAAGTVPLTVVPCDGDTMPLGILQKGANPGEKAIVRVLGTSHVAGVGVKRGDRVAVEDCILGEVTAHKDSRHVVGTCIRPGRGSTYPVVAITRSATVAKAIEANGQSAHLALSFIAGQDLRRHQYKAVGFGPEYGFVSLADDGSGLGILQNCPARGQQATVLVSGVSLVSLAHEARSGAMLYPTDGGRLGVLQDDPDPFTRMGFLLQDCQTHGGGLFWALIGDGWGRPLRNMN